MFYILPCALSHSISRFLNFRLGPNFPSRRLEFRFDFLDFFDLDFLDFDFFDFEPFRFELDFRLGVFRVDLFVLDFEPLRVDFDFDLEYLRFPAIVFS